MQGPRQVMYLQAGIVTTPASDDPAMHVMSNCSCVQGDLPAGRTFKQKAIVAEPSQGKPACQTSVMGQANPCLLHM